MKSVKSNFNKSWQEIPENFESYEDAAEFWDAHDVSDYLNLTEKVAAVKIRLKRHYFKLDPDIIMKLARKAREKGISTETLVNLWLQEKLFESEKLEHQYNKVSDGN